MIQLYSISFCFCRCGHPKKAIALFDFIIHNTPNISSNTISPTNISPVKSLFWNSNSNQIDAIRQKLRGLNIEVTDLRPSKKSITIEDDDAAYKLAKNKQMLRSFDNILSISKTFIDSNVQPNVRTYNTILKAFRDDKENSFKKGNELITKMLSRNIQPDSVTINTLVDIGVCTGNLIAAEQVSNY